MVNLKTLLLMALLGVSTQVCALPVHDKIYNECITKGYGDFKGKAQCEEHLVRRKRLEAKYANHGDYQGYEEKFDRFEKEFMFAWEEPLALQRVFYKRFSIYAEEKDYNDPIIIITLSPIPDEFDEPLNCNSIYWLLDDNIFSGFKTKRHYESEFNTITNTLNLDQLKQLLNANNIEFKYCGVEYKFTEKDKNAFRYVYRRYLDEKDVKNPKYND